MRRFSRLPSFGRCRAQRRHGRHFLRKSREVVGWTIVVGSQPPKKRCPDSTNAELSRLRRLWIDKEESLRRPVELRQSKNLKDHSVRLPAIPLILELLASDDTVVDSLLRPCGTLQHLQRTSRADARAQKIEAFSLMSLTMPLIPFVEHFERNNTVFDCLLPLRGKLDRLQWTKHIMTLSVIICVSVLQLVCAFGLSESFSGMWSDSGDCLPLPPASASPACSSKAAGDDAF